MSKCTDTYITRCKWCGSKVRQRKKEREKKYAFDRGTIYNAYGYCEWCWAEAMEVVVE